MCTFFDYPANPELTDTISRFCALHLIREQLLCGELKLIGYLGAVSELAVRIIAIRTHFSQAPLHVEVADPGFWNTIIDADAIAVQRERLIFRNPLWTHVQFNSIASSEYHQDRK